MSEGGLPLGHVKACQRGPDSETAQTSTPVGSIGVQVTSNSLPPTITAAGVAMNTELGRTGSLGDSGEYS